MGATPLLALPYPEGGDQPAGHTQIQALAQALDDQAAPDDGLLRGRSYGIVALSGTFTLNNSDTTWRTVPTALVAASDDVEFQNNGLLLARAGTWRVSGNLTASASTGTGFVGASLHMNIGSTASQWYGGIAITPGSAMVRNMHSATGYLRVPAGGTRSVVIQGRGYIDPASTTLNVQYADLTAEWIGP